MRIVELAPGERLGADALGRGRGAALDELAAAMRAVDEVRERGEAVLLERALEAAGAVALDSPIVAPEAQDEAFEQVDDAVLEEIYRAYQDIRDFHERTLRQGWFAVRPDGVLLGESVSAIPAVGVCLQGVHAVRPLDLLSCVLPARLAGVERVVLAVAPRSELFAEGGCGVSPEVLSAAHLAGVDEVILADGAHAVAALAYGAGGVAPVDKIVGFGGASAMAASRLVMDSAEMSLMGGPSVGCVLADAPESVTAAVAGLLAWEEGNPCAERFLVSWDARAVEQVKASCPDAELTAVLAADGDTAVAAVNEISPAYLGLHCDEGLGMLGRIHTSGAVVVGAQGATRAEHLIGSIGGPTVDDFHRRARVLATK